MGFLNNLFSTSWECPVCRKETSSANKGKVAFNGRYLCDNCSKKVEEVYKGKHIDRAYLEEMRAIVTGIYEDTDDNFVAYKNILSELYKKYEKLDNKHFELSNKINEQYSVAIHQDKLNNEVKKCMSLCMQDIGIADQLFEYYSKCKEILKNETSIPTFPAYSKVSRLYELFYHDYLNAIYFCYKGLISGYRDDSKNGFKGKIAKYLSKYNKEQGTNYQFDYDNVILFDDDTGEVIDLAQKILSGK